MSQSPLLILECANAHSGNAKLLEDTIRVFSQLEYPRKHIKFQAFHPNKIALPDFSYYEVYKDLFFPPETWMGLIKLASQLYDGVWLDVFDLYGVEILKDNIDNVFGVKIQASVAKNQEVFSAIRRLNLTSKTLMFNISGLDICDIQSLLERASFLNSQTLVLQLGFQSYPTKIEDSGVQKVKVLKSAFPDILLSMADHSPADDDLSMIVPLIAYTQGCDLIEKHICLNRKSAKYDGWSSLEISEIQILASRLISCCQMTSGMFISEAEKQYLSDSIQIPVSKVNLKAGTLISDEDVIYRRTSQKGISFDEIRSIQSKSYILSTDLPAGKSICIEQFRKARVGVIVACRMKSTRLPGKALLPINGVPSVERCLQNCMLIQGADLVVLATSYLEQDSVLKSHNLNGKVKVFCGDPDDVISRYLDVCSSNNIDIIIRVTADCPLVSPEIAKVLLESHFQNGADYTAAVGCAVGTGSEIYNVEALKRVANYFGKMDYSEYMTWYLRNNDHIFKNNFVDLPPNLKNSFRLTLDYQEDLDLLEKIYQELDTRGSLPFLSEVFNVLESHPDWASINSHLKLKYEVDDQLISLLDKNTKMTGNH